MKITVAVLAIGAGMIFWGCGSESSNDIHAEAKSKERAKTRTPVAASPELAKIIMIAGAPDDATAVAAARKDAKAGDNIKLLGRVKDFVNGQAVFTIVDPAIPACNDNPGDTCETPWDYCCEPKDKMAANMAT